MKNLLVQLRLNGKLDTTEDTNSRDTKMVRSLLNKIHLNVVDLIDYKEAGKDDLTNADKDDKPTLFEDETIVYVSIKVMPENETFLDNSHNLLKYIGDALDFNPSRVANYTEREDNGFTETTVTIILGEAVS